MSRVIVFLLTTAPAFSIVRQVGPGRSYAKPCAAIAAAASGDIIEIDAGNYAGDVCGWTTNNLTIRGVGGRAAIDAAGQSAQGKGIWVIAGNDTVIESIEFSGTHVADHNGAGIRQEGRNLTVRNCYFHDNDEGILAADNLASEILIESSEFAYNGFGDGFSHNIYINHVARFTLRFSYSHHSIEGHLVKSRATVNYILYNRLSDEATGTGSYEVDLPNGGTSYVIGNLIEQGPNSPNGTIVAYRLEGPNVNNPGTDLYVVNNTMVNDRPGQATFVNVAAGVPTPAVIKNNILSGDGTVTTQAGAVLAGNLTGGAPLFADGLNYDYHLQPGSPAIDAGVDPGPALTPLFQYVHPICGESRLAIGTIDIGAYEFAGGGALQPCGGAMILTTQTLASLTLDRTSVKGGVPVKGEVTLTAPAPATGITVLLASSSPGAASVPAAVTVRAGRTTESFMVRTERVEVDTAVTIWASLGGVVKSAPLMVTPKMHQAEDDE